MDQHNLRLCAASLTVLENIRLCPQFSCMDAVLNSLTKDVSAFTRAYGRLCHTIYQSGDAASALTRAIQWDQNALTASLEEPAAYLLDAATRDLRIIQQLAGLQAQTLIEFACDAFPDDKEFLKRLPVFPTGKPLPLQNGAALCDTYRACGFGRFAGATAFSARHDGIVEAIVHHDKIRLRDLKGYARQKESILENTRSFLAGAQANNILLYGDKGTGKSSTVKAVVNEYADRGLKIIELPISEIDVFPSLCEQIAQSPFKFIVFLDDLSFNQEDENFTALKAFVEGGITEKPDNLILYATSNRRHLVNEHFSDRQGDEIHVRDTLEAITSLSDRFGLEITFAVPDKDEYLKIVEELSAEQGLLLPQQDLYLRAERFALRRNGRSPRTARQFIQYALAQRAAEQNERL